jgi:hypothetical protein
LNSFRNLSLSILSPVNTVGSSPANFPFVVIVRVVVLPVGAMCDPCPDAMIGAGATYVVICGVRGLLYLVMKSWIWLAILEVIVGWDTSGISGWVSYSMIIVSIAMASVISVSWSASINLGSSSSGVCVLHLLPVLGVASCVCSP